MKRELVLVVMILGWSSVVMGGASSSAGPDYTAKSSLLATSDGIHIGKPEFEGSSNYPGGLGTIGYSVAVEPELKATKELAELTQSRLQQSPLKPSGRLSLSRENRVVLYTESNKQIQLPIERTTHSVFQNPHEVFIAFWSFTTDSPPRTDLVLALTEARFLIFAVQEENPGLWLASWIPVPFKPVDQERLNDQGFGLYQAGGQFVLFLPFERGDQAWEIHIPETFENSLRFNVFPLTTEEL